MSPEELIALLVSAGDDCQRRLDALLLERHGLSWPQYLILKSLAGGSPTSQTRLAASLGRSKGNITGMLRRLEADGFIVRQPEAKDGRVRRVELGPRASCLPQADRDVAQLAAAQLGGFTPAERRTLGELLRRLPAPPPGEAGEEPSRQLQLEVDAPAPEGEEAPEQPAPGRLVLPPEEPRFLRLSV